MNPPSFILLDGPSSLPRKKDVFLGIHSTLAGADALLAGAAVGGAERPRRVALRGGVHGAGEGGGEVGVEADDAADVVVELPDEADVAGEVVGRPGLVVVVDLADERPVLVEDALHLHEALVERLDHLPVHRRAAGAVRHAAGEAVAAVHLSSLLSSVFSS
jgi:hypothetical protein